MADINRFRKWQRKVDKITLKSIEIKVYDISILIDQKSLYGINQRSTKSTSLNMNIKRLYKNPIFLQQQQDKNIV